MFDSQYHLVAEGLQVVEFLRCNCLNRVLYITINQADAVLLDNNRVDYKCRGLEYIRIPCRQSGPDVWPGRIIDIDIPAVGNCQVKDVRRILDLEFCLRGEEKASD